MGGREDTNTPGLACVSKARGVALHKAGHQFGICSLRWEHIHFQAGTQGTASGQNVPGHRLSTSAPCRDSCVLWEEPGFYCIWSGVINALCEHALWQRRDKGYRFYSNSLQRMLAAQVLLHLFSNSDTTVQFWGLIIQSSSGERSARPWRAEWPGMPQWEGCWCSSLCTQAFPTHCCLNPGKGWAHKHWFLCRINKRFCVLTGLSVWDW